MQHSKPIDWVWVEDTSSYVEEALPPPNEESFLASRVYRKKGRRYPLLSISVYGDLASRLKLQPKLPPVGITIAISFKKSKEAWWSDHDVVIPWSLLPDLQEMLEKVKTDSKITGV